MGFVEDDGDFDLGGGDHLDVHAAVPEAFEEGRGHSGVRTHTDANDAELGDAALFEDFAGADFRADALDHRADFYQFLGGEGE